MVSICALGLSVWQAYSGRRHNMLTVRPFLQVHHFIDDNKRKIILKNCGLGPAILTEIVLLTPLPVKATSKNWELYMKSIGFTGQVNAYYITDDEDALSVSQERYILDLSFEGLSGSPLQKVQEHLNNLQIRFNYKSMYNQTFKHTSSKLLDE